MLAGRGALPFVGRWPGLDMLCGHFETLTVGQAVQRGQALPALGASALAGDGNQAHGAQGAQGARQGDMVADTAAFGAAQGQARWWRTPLISPT